MPGSIQSYYVQQQINGYFNGVRVLEEGGFSREEAVEHVLETTEVSAEVVLEDQSGYEENGRDLLICSGTCRMLCSPFAVTV